MVNMSDRASVSESESEESGETMGRSLVALLEERREREGMTDGRFAETLGISPSLWSLVKAGKRPARWAILDAVLRVYPDLWNVCCRAFRRENGID